MLCSIRCNNIGDTGASALAAILKETMISNLECAATLKVFAFLSAPIDTPQQPPPLPCWQSAFQQTRSPRRSCSRRGPEGQHHAALAGVGRPPLEPAPQVFAFVSAPIDTATPHLCSLRENQLCGLDQCGHGTYTANGIIKLCEGLKGSAVTSLECAAARVFAFMH